MNGSSSVSTVASVMTSASAQDSINCNDLHRGAETGQMPRGMLDLPTDTSNEDIYQWKADGVWDIQTNGIGLLNPMPGGSYLKIENWC